MRLFQDRRDAGRQLAVRLRHLRGEDPIVVGLPRGGVPVAFEVARALDAAARRDRRAQARRSRSSRSSAWAQSAKTASVS